MKQYMGILNETIFSDPRARPPIKTIVEKIKAIFTSSIKTETYQSFLNSLLEREPITKEEDNAQLKEELQEEVQEIPGTILEVAEEM
jgi:hypothetical protein